MDIRNFFGGGGAKKQSIQPEIKASTTSSSIPSTIAPEKSTVSF
jgi:hypothetical protein